jgi:hypothetical protein
VTGQSPLPFPGPIRAGGRPWRGPGGDHRASWSSPDSARILARTRSRAATIVGPSGPRPDSIATSGTGPALEARSVTSLGSLPLDLGGRRPRPAGGLADHLDRDLDMDDLDFAANTVAKLGEGKSQKSGITLDEPTVSVLADRVAARWRAQRTAARPARRSRPSVPGNSPLPFLRPRPSPGRVSGEDLDGDHAATWSSPSSARAVARACSSAVTITRPSSPLRHSRVSRTPTSVRMTRSVTFLGSANAEDREREAVVVHAASTSCRSRSASIFKPLRRAWAGVSGDVLR